MSLTFDPTIGSSSNFYISFRRLFPCGRNGIASRWRAGLVEPFQHNGSKASELLIRPMDQSWICTGVFGCLFARSRYEISTLWSDGRIAPDQSNGGSDRWITPEFLQEFLEAIFLVVAMESLLCEVKVRSHLTRVTTKKGSNFLSDRWIVLKRLQQFPEAVFLALTMEALLGEEQVSSCQTTVTPQKHLNFWSDRWITPEFLQEFLETILLIVVMKSLLCEAKVQSR
jgi:hypothetical protein